MEGLELISFQIISAVGSARSYYIEAIEEAKSGNIVRAKELIEEGETVFVEGHHAHAQLIQQEAVGNPVQMQLLLTHAEDQLMSAETFGILSKQFVDLYEKMYSKNLL